MRKNHLTALDYEKYLDCDDMSEEYLEWLTPVASHLADCKHCRNILQHVSHIDYIREEGAAGISWLAQKTVKERRSQELEQLKKELWTSGQLDDEVRGVVRHFIDEIISAQIRATKKVKEEIRNAAKAWYNAAEYDTKEGPVFAFRALFNPDAFPAGNKVTQGFGGMPAGAQAMKMVPNRGYSMFEGSVENVSYEDGCIVVGVKVRENADHVWVVLSGSDAEVIFREAELHRKRAFQGDYVCYDLWIARIKCDYVKKHYDIYTYGAKK